MGEKSVLHSTSPSAELTLFRVMCLAFGSTISPGIMEERLSLCGFIHIMRAFLISFFFFLFCHAWKTSRNKQYHRDFFCSCLSSGPKWSCGGCVCVCNQSLRKQVCSQKWEACSQDLWICTKPGSDQVDFFSKGRLVKSTSSKTWLCLQGFHYCKLNHPNIGWAVAK